MGWLVIQSSQDQQCQQTWVAALGQHSVRQHCRKELPSCCGNRSRSTLTVCQKESPGMLVEVACTHRLLPMNGSSRMLVPMVHHYPACPNGSGTWSRWWLHPPLVSRPIRSLGEPREPIRLYFSRAPSGVLCGVHPRSRPPTAPTAPLPHTSKGLLLRPIFVELCAPVAQRLGVVVGFSGHEAAARLTGVPQRCGCCLHSSSQQAGLQQNTSMGV